MTGELSAAGVGVICPMPTGDGPKVCAKDLHIVWSASRGLYLLDVTTPEPIRPDDAWVQSWTVECEAGHVLLVPDALHCPHYPGGDEPDDHLCDVDSTDEYRTFRAADGARLAVALARINAANLAPAGEVRTDG